MNNLTLLSNNHIENSTFTVWLIERLYRYVALPTGLIFGTSFNLLTIIVIFKSKLWKTTFFRYVFFLAISDFFVCLAYILRSIGIVFGQYMTPTIYTIIECKISFFLNISFSQSSALLLALITIDRYICIAHPMKANVWSTLKVCNKASISINIFVFLLSFYYFFASNESVRISPTRMMCLMNSKLGEFTTKYFYTYLNLITSIIPSIILIVFNILITFNLKRHMSEMSNLNDSKKTDNQKAENQKTVVQKLTIISILISTFFIFCTFPLSIFSELESKKLIKLSSTATQFGYDILFIVNLLNYVINFIFYCACGETFRKELIKLFCNFKKDDDSKIQNSKSTLHPTAI